MEKYSSKVDGIVAWIKSCNLSLTLMWHEDKSIPELINDNKYRKKIIFYFLGSVDQFCQMIQLGEKVPFRVIISRLPSRILGLDSPGH